MQSLKFERNGRTYEYDRETYADPNRIDGRRTLEGKRKGWQVAEMWDRHHEIARRLLLGESNRYIAEKLGISAQQVSNVKNSPVVQEKLIIMQAARDAGCIDLAKEITAMAPIALQRIKEALETGKVLDKEVSASALLKECNNMVDREIGKAVQRVDTRNVHGHFTLEDINKIKERAKELSAKSGQMA